MHATHQSETHLAKNRYFLFVRSEHQGEKDDYDPFAESRRPTIAEKEDEYRQRRRHLVISPERADPFADGLYIFTLSLLIARTCVPRRI